jgi:hypothetical protein
VLNKEDWSVISEFFDTHIVDSTDRRAVYAVRLDYLMHYLKVIDFDLTKFGLNRTNFGTGYSAVADIDNSKPICTLDNDIQSLHLIDKLYSKYKKMIYPDTQAYIAEDITKDYMSTNDYRYRIYERRVAIPIRDGLDGISKKFVSKYSTPIKIEAIRSTSGITTLVNRFEDNNSMITLSVRVYLQYFLQKFKCKKGDIG